MKSLATNWVSTLHDFRRRHERKNYHIEIMFVSDGRMFKGRLKDIGMGGAFILSHHADLFFEGEQVTISIPFTDGRKHLKRKGTVLWKNGKGFAIGFN